MLRRNGRRATVLVALLLGGLLPGPLLSVVDAGPVGASPPSDGLFAGAGVSGFGDASTYGSFAGTTMSAPAVAMAATPAGKGYWVAGADGGVFAFGDATFYGSTGSLALYAPVVGMAATPDDQGYCLVAATAGVLPFGDAQFYGPSPNLPPFSPTAAIAATPDGRGYWLLQPDDLAVGFANPPPGGGAGIVATAASQVGPDLSAGTGTGNGNYCNPYGPCEEWCALFVTWVWETQGIPIPQYAFTGDIFGWGAARGLDLGPGAVPSPGDAVLFGTGPSTTATSVHVGIVAQVWPDGAIISIEGDAGPEPDGKGAVIINGPYLPSQSPSYNGYPIYAYVQP